MRFQKALGRLVLGFILFAGSASVLAGETIEASSVSNPAPTEVFSSFDRFEVAKVTMGSPYAGQKPNDLALTDLQADMDRRIEPWISGKNAQPAKNDPPRVLLIEPRIEKIRFISTGARMWGGAFSGTSRVLLKIRISDKSTGTLVAEPEFYQQAAGMAGAWSFGGADKGMLERTAGLAADYLQANFTQAVGGKTGKQ